MLWYVMQSLQKILNFFYSVFVSSIRFYVGCSIKDCLRFTHTRKNELFFLRSHKVHRSSKKTCNVNDIDGDSSSGFVAVFFFVYARMYVVILPTHTIFRFRLCHIQFFMSQCKWCRLIFIWATPHDIRSEPIQSIC